MFGAQYNGLLLGVALLVQPVPVSRPDAGDGRLWRAQRQAISAKSITSRACAIDDDDEEILTMLGLWLSQR